MSLSETMTRKVGPLPLGAWLAAVAGGLYLQHRSAAKAAAPAGPVDPVTGGPLLPAPSTPGVTNDLAPVVLSPIFHLPAITNTITNPPATINVAAPTVTVPAPVVAAPAPAAASSARTYTVRPGDNLSVIAARQGVAGGWRALYDANRGVVGGNPNLIYPGQVLRLP